MNIVTKLCVVLGAGLLCVQPALATEYASRAEMEQMRREIQELRELVGDLKGVIEQQRDTIDELSRQTEAAEQAVAAADEGDAAHGGGSLHDALKAFRPNIGIASDFVANLSEDHHLSTEEDRFDLRAVDIELSGEIENFGHVFVNAAYEEDEFSIEEAYVVAEELLPLGTDLKLGKFRASYGLLNTVHPNELPQVDYPAIYREYLGHDGYIDEGVGIGGRIASPWQQPFEWSLQVLNGNRHDHGHSDDAHGHDEDAYGRLRDYDDLTYVARLHNRFDVSDRLKMKWGLSGMAGRYEQQVVARTSWWRELLGLVEYDTESSRFYYQGADFTMIMRPFDADYKRIRWQTEGITGQIEKDSSWERTWGMYSFVDYQFRPAWIIGARYDYTDRLLDASDRLTEYSAYLTYDLNASNRLRVQWKTAHRDWDKDTNEVFLQWIFRLGQHEHEADPDFY